MSGGVVNSHILTIHNLPCEQIGTKNMNFVVFMTFLVLNLSRGSNGAGRGRRMGSSSLSCMVLSYSIPTSPRMTEKTFSPHPSPLGPHEALSHHEKLYFLLICPIVSRIFFNETYFINKNILEIITKFIPSN